MKNRFATIDYFELLADLDDTNNELEYWQQRKDEDRYTRGLWRWLRVRAAMLCRELENRDSSFEVEL